MPLCLKYRTGYVYVTASSGDCGVTGETITAIINKAGKKCILVSPKSATTDANGLVEFKIKARKKGTVEVTFKACNLEATLPVTVKKSCEDVD